MREPRSPPDSAAKRRHRRPRCAPIQEPDAVAGVPPALLQIGDDDDRAAIASMSGSHVGGGSERRAIARRAEPGGGAVDRRPRQRPIRRRLKRDRGLVGERDDADQIAGGRAVDRLPGELLGPLELPAADMLSDVSSATTVMPDVAPYASDGKNGRANASARSSSAVTRSASSSSSRRCCFWLCSTGAPRSSFTAENCTRASGSRLSRCSTIGTAAASAPARNSGERNAITASSRASRDTPAAPARAAGRSSAGGSRSRTRQARACSARSARRSPRGSARAPRPAPP